MSEEINKINEMEVAGDCESEQKENNEKTSEESSGSSSSTSSTSDASKSEENAIEPPTKRRRKRKRHPKKKKSTSTAYSPEEPFTARYEKLQIFINSALPKVHLRFNEEGDADNCKSDFNYKPRVIKALIRNLELNENVKDEDKKLEMEVTQEIEPEIVEEVISLKPRIIKAIGH